MERSKRPTLKYPVLVEGKYDKAKIKSLFNATVITTDGFGIFNLKEKQALIKKISEKGIILLTDSDGAGGVIRSFLKGILPPDKVINLYSPRIEGKEKRKAKPSREGVLGVEGMTDDELLRILSPFAEAGGCVEKNLDLCKEKITISHFYAAKLTGAEQSSKKRDTLAKRFGLPEGMNTKALLEALNIISDLEEFLAVMREI